MQVGWAVIGCSDIVRRRAAAAIRDQADSRLVAFHSRNAERASAFASDYGAEYGTEDLHAVLADDRVTIAYIATEVDRHCELTLAAAGAGKHVLVEKPMALDTAECRRMIEAARAAGVHLAVAYYVRFFEKSRLMKQVLEEGRLGKVVRAVVRNIDYYDPAPEDPQYWRVDGRGGGNNLADVGSHRLDLLCYFLGRPVKVMGLADRLSHAYLSPDSETALVQYENGAHVVAMANTNVRFPSTPATSIEIYGTEGSLFTDPWSADPVKVIGSEAEPLVAAPPANAHSPLIDDFAKSIATGRKPRFDGEEGMWATAIIAASYESAQTGRAVHLG